MSSDAEMARIVFLIMGSFNILLGFLMMKYQLADIIAGFDERKYDRKKSADIVGSNFLLMGLLMILITIIYYFVPSLGLNLYVVSILIVWLGLIVKIVWDTSKHAKIRRE